MNEIEKLQRQVRQLTLFKDAADVLHSTSDVEVLVRATIALVRAVYSAEGASLCLKDETGDALRFYSVYGVSAAKVTETLIPRGQGIAWWVLENGQTTVVEDVAKDTRFYNGVDEKSEFKTRSLIAAPVMINNSNEGVIEVVNPPAGEPFAPEDADLLESICEMVGKEFAYARANAKLKETYNELQENVKNTNYIIDSLTEIMIVTDKAGIIQRVNRAFEHQMLYNRDDVIGKKLETYFTEDTSDVGLTVIRRASSVGKSLFNRKCSLRTKLGEDIHINLNGFPLINSENEIIGALLLARDIEEVVALSEELLKR